MKKVAGDNQIIYHYDRFGNLLGESTIAGDFVAQYIYLGDTRLAAIDGGADCYYYINDHLGTPQKMIDNTSAVVWSADYKPFGEADVNVSAVGNNFRFPGQYFDQETGLDYNYFRYYHSQIGRYLTSDPIGLLGGINLYAYAGNNPIMFMDPNGLCFKAMLEGIGTALTEGTTDAIQAFKESAPVWKMAGQVVLLTHSVSTLKTAAIYGGVTLAAEAGLAAYTSVMTSPATIAYVNNPKQVHDFVTSMFPGTTLAMTQAGLKGYVTSAILKELGIIDLTNF